MAKKLNTPSANFLIPREHRIRAIQELYDAVKNGGGGGGGSIEDLTPAQKAALNSGITADKLNELETGVSGAVQTSSQSLTESQKSTARNNIGALGTNDVPPVPSGGWAAANDLSALDAYVHSLNTTPVVVGPKPETGTEGTIYRVPGDTTYTDWMYYNGTWSALATYDAATLESQFGYYKWTGTGNAIALTTSNQDAGSPIGSYDIKTGGSFKIKMTNAATGAATLSMNGKTATPLFYNGAVVSASNTWESGEVISVYYDGTNYQASNAMGGGSAVGKKVINPTATNRAITTNGDTIGAVITNNATNWCYAKYAVNEGDVVMISGTGGSSPRLWAIADVSENILSKEETINATREDFVLVMPAGAKWIVLNNNGNEYPDYKWYYAKAGSVGADAILAKLAQYTKYDNSQSGLAVDNVQEALDELNNNTNELSDDLYEATNFTSENVFDIAAAAVATNNTTYITPLKLEDGGRWTIAKKDTGTNRVGHITIPVLVVGKHYKITFNYTSTLTVAASVQLCRHDSTSGSNVRVATVSGHGSIAAGASGIYSFEFTYGATTTRYLGFVFKQPAVGQLIEIHNLTICETNSVKDAVQKLINESFIQDSDADSDLDIVDPQGNVLARFYNGHIKTKNFDSSEWINLTSKFKDKKFAIVGDSISTYNGWLPSSKSGYSGSTYATYYPHTGGDVQSATQIWWYKLLVKLGIAPSKWNNINVVSWSGSTVCGDSTSTTNAKPACSDKRIADIGLDGFTPDIIIVFISCNDWGLDYALGTWQVSDAIPAEGNITKARAAYALMLHKIHTTYPKARVFCCTILDDIKRDRVAGWPSDNNNGVTTHQWNQNIKEIAEAFGCDVIDMHACGINYQNIASLVVDEGLHPNDEGHTMMAEKVFAELIAKY